MDFGSGRDKDELYNPSVSRVGFAGYVRETVRNTDEATLVSVSHHDKQRSNAVSPFFTLSPSLARSDTA